MAEDTHRNVTLSRIETGRYELRNPAGARLEFGSGDDEFSAVELLMGAIGGCTAADVDSLTSRRAEPIDFEIQVDAEKIRDDDGNRLKDIEVTFRLRFPEGEAGDEAREVYPKAVELSHDRLCTVGRTVQLPTPITNHVE
ncbi:MAG: OsmC family peroxiredoxin [Acidimicrobiia bacterium]|nr:OsmC family peroxiredoxin [Acidimicrobiia bacterium]